MSPLKISLVLDVWCQSKPLADLPEDQAYSGAMYNAVDYFIREGIFHANVTLIDLRRGTGGEFAYPELGGHQYLTDKGIELVQRLEAVKP